jgi:DNA-binding MarR family transcriptional regulator
VERAADPQDARRKIVRLTGRGVDVLDQSARLFDAIQIRWAEALGEDRLAALHADLRTMTPGELFRLDVPGWFGAEH